MLTFDEMLEQLPDGAPTSILLGNGFSRAWSDETFRYDSLYAAADFGERERVIRQLFDALGTYDFERVTSRLQGAAEIVRVYRGDEALARLASTDADAIKDALVRAIADTHPARPSEIMDGEYECVRRFLARFSAIYTVNYDLLMYWARNQDQLEPAGWRTDDGFRQRQLWSGQDAEQEVFFLHGALHLYNSRQGVKKHAFSARAEPIIDTVRANLERGVFPLFVSEPSSRQKLRRINENPYLSYCLRRLSRERGSVFVLGHQLTDVDQHIYAAVDSSHVRNVFVSIFGDPESEANRRVRGNAFAWLATRERTVDFVQAETVPVWQPV